MDAPREPESADEVLPEAPLVPLRAVLVPPSTKGHVSVARMTAHWFIVAQSRDLGAEPKPTMLMGMPLVLFRDGEGKAGALLDRCPHRNIPLSLGSVQEG